MGGRIECYLDIGEFFPLGVQVQGSLELTMVRGSVLL